MKRSYLLLLLLLIFPVLAACDSNDNTDSPDSHQETPHSPISRGIWQDATYTSTYADIVFALPAGWSVYDDQQLADNINLEADSFAQQGEEFSQAMLQLPTINELLAIDPASGNSIIIIYENLAQNSGGNDLSAEAYLSSMQSLIEQAAPDYVFAELSEQIIGGEQYTCLSGTSAETSTTVFVRKIDSYLLVISINIAGQTDINDLLANFS